jgi:SAM-dependent methyltransferase
MKPKFTSDWFSNNIERWEKHVKPKLLKYGKGVRILDIAPYEGRSTLWLLDNIPGCHVTVLQTSTNKKVIKNLDNNLQPYKNRASILVGGLEQLSNMMNEAFDFINIDIGVDARFTLEAAVTSFNLLKPGGLMVFDDYTTDRLHGYQCPKPAIDAFTGSYSRYIKIFHASWQLMLLKRKKPLSIASCKSEYYHEDLNTV